jgi:ADP-ribosylglycohydrolase/catechol 2,3-dioxygenase-like lactoylglutathione lyase family enzyme
MNDSNFEGNVSQHVPASPERAIAAFIGAAVGDALGWPFEGRAARKPNIRNWDGQFFPWQKRSGSRFSPRFERVAAGAYSDDTQLILAVARARTTRSDWWEHFARVELPFWTCYERGGGGATKRAANSWLAGTAPWDSTSRDTSKRYFDAGGNGVVMRVLPHCVARAKDESFTALARDILADGVSTHGHPRALVGALVFAYVLWHAFKRVETLEYGALLRLCIQDAAIWSELPDISHEWATWRSAAEKHTTRYERLWAATVGEVESLCHRALKELEAGVLSDDRAVMKELGSLSPKTNGAGTTTAIAALYYASRYAASPLEGIRCAATTDGADTDTLASMTGSLLGIINGAMWLNGFEKNLQDAGYVRKTAESLAFGHKSRAICSHLTKRDVSDVKSLLLGSRPLSDFVLPIGLQVNAIELKHEEYGEQLMETVVVSTEAGLTLFIPVSTTKRTDGPRYSMESREAKEFSSTESERFSQTSTPTLEGFEPVVGVAILVKDINASRAFYENFLGLTVTGVTQKSVRFSPALVLREGLTAPDSCVGIKFFVNVASIDAISRVLGDVGIEHSAIVVRGNTRSFECLDPSGYVIEVFERMQSHRSS